jgi:cytochrome c peroxidase
VIATKKGVNILERGSQTHFMAEFQVLLDFLPAPKLDVFGRLDPSKASEAEVRGQAIFFGKGQCAACHIPPYYTDGLMHNLRTERSLQASPGQRPDGKRRRPDQDLPLARHQGLAALSP